jgi:hypothetical protein
MINYAKTKEELNQFWSVKDSLNIVEWLKAPTEK